MTFCNGCEISLRKNKIPKFSAMNFVNITLCQAYPAELEGLTYIEECVIALAVISQTNPRVRESRDHGKSRDVLTLVAVGNP